MVAGLYSNRVKDGMLLQADPPSSTCHQGQAAGPAHPPVRNRRDQRLHPYDGRPAKGPITNPGREAIAAVLDPAETSARYMVADGTGGHAFAETLEEHNRNVAKWFEIRRKRGEM